MERDWRFRHLFTRSVGFLVSIGVAITVLMLCAAVVTQMNVYISGCPRPAGQVGTCLGNSDKKVPLWYWLGHTDQQLTTNTDGVPDVYWHDAFLF